MANNIDVLKQRLARQGQGQNPPVPPSTESADPPAPAQPAAPPQKVEPQIDPEIIKALEESKRQAEEKAAVLQRSLDESEAKYQAMLKTQAEAVKLPSKEELGRMEQGEALEAVLKATKAMLDQRTQNVVADLKANALAPIQKKLAEADIAAKRDIAGSVYGDEVVAKYRSQFEERCRQHPDMPACDVLKSVADPADLSQAARPTTPSTSAQAAAAAMATGVSARAGAPVKPPAQDKPAVIDYLDASAKARAAGDRHTADVLRREGLKSRLAALGQVPGA